MSNIVLPSSDFNDNTVTFSSDLPGYVKLVGPGKSIGAGESVEGASGLCPAILYWSELIKLPPFAMKNPRIFVVQFPPTTWQPGKTVTISGEAPLLFSASLSVFHSYTYWGFQVQ